MTTKLRSGPVRKKGGRIIDMNSKAAKFFVAHRLHGKTRKQAAVEAGITMIENVPKAIRTDTYQALEQKYAEVLQREINMQQVAVEHAKNILQDSDKGAKNVAIKMFMDKVEPEQQKRDLDEQLVVVLRQSLG